jgi:pimeloyl-ACP methyl ester carboxylesterase
MNAEEAYQLFMTPGRPAPRARREQELADRGEPLTLEVFGITVRGHRWGSGPRVLVQHGWGTRATAMWAQIKAVEAAGFEVYAFDAPGNGDSDSDISTMFHFAETMRVAGEAFGPFAGVVTHSIASSGLPLALSQGLKADRVAMMSPRDELAKFLTRFLELADISKEHFDGVMAIWDRELGWNRVLDATPSVLAPAFDFPALIIHDRDDEDVDYQDSERIHAAWRNSELMLTDGLGHARIVRSDEVAQRIVQFLSSPRG